ncbi:hypothetical protein [Limnoglobus roseus]|uniref:Uncharacterized protein n=1 Tax=Limnoglobus roseus TaxID=2598579 RepID=A0A5C1AAT5_9BACT|nr:hypothetical protein [Limnoglobus roseus]QEL14148.1 hypothetical protein PX52LOC_01018 [Limnoglobus roseus]
MTATIEDRDLPFLAMLLGARDGVFRADRFGPAEEFVSELRRRWRAKGHPWSATAAEWDGQDDVGSRAQAMRLHEMGVIRLNLRGDAIASAHIKLPKETAAAVREAVRAGRAGEGDDAAAWIAYRQARRFMRKKLAGEMTN